MLPEHHIQWFEQLVLAAKNDDLALVLCTDADSGEDRSVIAIAQQHDDDDGAVTFIPLGHLATTENPFDAYNPPETEPRKTH